jgi:nicotinamidase-related amidase
MPLDVRPLVVPSTTALLVNEMQANLVGGEHGIGGAGARVLPGIVRLADAARSSGVQVMHCVKIFRRDSLARNRNVVMYRRQGAVPAEPPPPDGRPVDGTYPCPELGPDERDIVMSRLHGLGSVTDTGVVPVLRNLGITTVVVTGISLNVGIPNAVMDLVNHAFEVVVPRDAVAGVPDEYGEQVIEHTIRVLATVTTVDELISAWSVA